MTGHVMTALSWLLMVLGLLYFPLSIAAVVGIALLER